MLRWCSMIIIRQLQRGMDNLHLQLTPVQITYQSKDPISVSCLFKKVVISTGHLLEKHEIKANSDLRAGRASFADGPVFSMSKDFQLSNTKISLHFLAKKERNISCIGSAEIDVAALPNQPYSMLEVKLDNCADPKARIKLEVQRKETQQSKRSRREEPKGEKMDLLSTEGQRKEEMIINRRANPNIPTAYEISRRNYKQVEISCHEDKKADKKSTSSKKSISYQKRHYAINTSNINSKPPRNEEAARQSPMPRRQTPEPIQLNSKPTAKPLASRHRAKEGSLQGQQNRQTFGRSNQEPAEEPQCLKIKPYPEEARENIENYNHNGFHNLQDEKNHKYKYITEKLQKIHDKIATSKDKRRLLTEENSENVSECDQLSQQYHRSCLEKSILIEDKSELHEAKSEAKSAISAVNSFNPLSSSQVDGNSNEQTSHILASLNDSPEQKEGTLQRKDQDTAIEQKFEGIKDMKEKSPSASPPSEKTISFKNNPSYRQKAPLKQPQLDDSQQQLIEDKEIAQAEIEVYKKEIENYKKELVAALKNSAEKDKCIQEIEAELEECKTALKDKQGLLSKLNEEYEREFESNFALKERIAELEAKGKMEESVVGELKLSELSKAESNRGNDRSSQLKAISDELAKAKKRTLDAESQLKFKQNENKCLLLEIDNIKREKRSLEQEIQILVSKDRNEMTRKASLARIEQINTSSLSQHTKRENQALKNQVKILLQKLQSLNLLFQSFLRTGERPQLPEQEKSVPKQVEVDKKYKYMQQKCVLLEEQLKKKKNEMAEIINLIWKHQSGDLMNEVFALITESS